MDILSFVQIVAPTALLLLVLPIAAAGYRDGPSPGVTGGFGEPTCQQCHFDQPLNDRGGGLELTGVPERYVPGRSYAITITLSREGLTRGGFEMSARFASGDRTSRQAGAWRAVGDRLQIVPSETDSALQFLQHTGHGSIAPHAGALGWTMEWIAPGTGTDEVQFNVAANASNDDASPLGDYVYTREIRSVPQ